MQGEIVSNTQDLLDDILERQKRKFGPTTKEELYRKLRTEILEYQEATRAFFMTGSREYAEAMKFEEADIIIVANRLWQEFHDEVAWALLSKYYNYESARYVKAKWEIVEKRPYKRTAAGDWQHEEQKIKKREMKNGK